MTATSNEEICPKHNIPMFFVSAAPGPSDWICRICELEATNTLLRQQYSKAGKHVHELREALKQAVKCADFWSSQHPGEYGSAPPDRALDLDNIRHLIEETPSVR